MKVQLIDCTLRDGWNFNNWFFTEKDIHEVVQNLDRAGVDIIEVGYRGGSGSNRSARVGKAAQCSREFLEQLPVTRQASLAVMVVPSACSIDTLGDLDNKLVRWVRVATYPHNAEEALPYVYYLKSRGFQVGMNLMAASYINGLKIRNIAKIAEDAGVDVFYIADSYGGMTPDDVRERILATVETVSCPVGFHGHNNLGLAFTNALEALKSGATYIDTSLCGMARGAGNLPTEQFVSAMNYWKRFEIHYQVEPVLQAAEYVLYSILQTPMKISTPEIVSGLSNLHYYYYDLVKAKCRENNLNLLEVGKKLGQTFPHKVDTFNIDKIIDQMMELKG